MDKIPTKVEGIPTKIKWKIHPHCISSFEGTSYKELSEKSPDLLHQQISFFHKFLELPSTLSEKKIFVTNFPFLMNSINPPHPPSIPLMAKIGWVWRKVFEPPTKFLKRGYLIGPQLLEPHFLKVTKNLLTFKRKDSAKDEKL